VISVTGPQFAFYSFNRDKRRFRGFSRQRALERDWSRIFLSFLKKCVYFLIYVELTVRRTLVWYIFTRAYLKTGVMINSGKSLLYGCFDSLQIRSLDLQAKEDISRLDPSGFVAKD